MCGAICGAGRRRTRAGGFCTSEVHPNLTSEGHATAVKLAFADWASRCRRLGRCPASSLLCGRGGRCSRTKLPMSGLTPTLSLSIDSTRRTAESAAPRNVSSYISSDRSRPLARHGDPRLSRTVAAPAAAESAPGAIRTTQCGCRGLRPRRGHGGCMRGARPRSARRSRCAGSLRLTSDAPPQTLRPRRGPRAGLRIGPRP